MSKTTEPYPLSPSERIIYLMNDFDRDGWPDRNSDSNQKPNRLMVIAAVATSVGAIAGGGVVGYELYKHPDKAPKALLAGAGATASVLGLGLASRRRNRELDDNPQNISET